MFRPTPIAVLLFLVLIPTLITLGEAEVAVRDADIWYHMKAGEWIVEHRQAIGVDPFSRYGREQGVEWIAYSWLFEVLLHVLHQAFGLAGFPVYVAGMMVLIVLALAALLRGLSGNWMVVAGLTLLGYFGMRHLDAPRPWLLTILCFILELHVLLTVRRTGRTGRTGGLLLLPPLFVLWANVHIQYAYGLVMLGCALSESLLQRFLPPPSPPHDGRSVPLGPMLATFAACVGATLVNPYHYHIYEPGLGLLGQGELWGAVNELLAPSFRLPADWVLLGTTLAVAFAVGYRRRCPLFLLLLYVGGAYLSFRSARDSWFVLVSALCILGNLGDAPAYEAASQGSGLLRAVGALVLACVVVCALSMWKLSNATLAADVAAVYPEEAARFIEGRGLPGPIFNHYNWGGYLIWRLPGYPASMDGRTLVHGTQRILRHIDTFKGKSNWKTDPDLAQAGVLLVMRDSALTTLLRQDRDFELVHQDAIAAVFVPASKPGQRAKKTE